MPQILWGELVARRIIFLAASGRGHFAAPSCNSNKNVKTDSGGKRVAESATLALLGV
jgi:hypothetical protein